MSTKDNNEGGPGVSAKEGELFQTILLCMKNKPEVDWDLVAEKAGYSNGRCASTRYGQIIKKLTGSTPASAAMSTNGKKAKTVGSGTNTKATKVTKAKGRAGSKAKGKIQEQTIDDQNEYEENIEEPEKLVVDDADNEDEPEGYPAYCYGYDEKFYDVEKVENDV